MFREREGGREDRERERESVEGLEIFSDSH